jgi:CBS domain-containing protein
VRFFAPLRAAALTASIRRAAPAEDTSHSGMDWSAAGGGGASSDASSRPAAHHAAGAAAAPLPSASAAPHGGAGGAGGASAGASAGPAVPPAGGGGLARSLGAAAASASEADASRARILEFLQRHTAYELIPESSKVVVLDTAIPVRQAFHALFEQGVHTAPLWHAPARGFVGVISPGDFIALLCRLQSSAGSPPTLSELELDALTIEAWMRDAAAEGGRGGAPPPALVSVCPEDSLHAVAHALLRSGSGALPMLSTLGGGGGAGAPAPPGPGAAAAGAGAGAPGAGAGAAATPGGATPGAARTPDGRPATSQLLHMSTMSGTMVARDAHCDAHRTHRTLFPCMSALLTRCCAPRRPRAGVLACLMRHFRGVPNALPLLSQPLGRLPIGTWSDVTRHDPAGSGEPQRPLVTMHPSTPLKTALAMLLQAGVGALPIVDDVGTLLDVYARNDILALARNNAYSQLPLDSISVSQALHYMKAGAGAGGAGAAFAAPAEAGGGGPPRRCYTCTRADSLRTAMETLALPGVTRLVCVQAGTQRIEGIITLSDIASFLFV